MALSEDGFALVLALFDSTITYRARFQARRELAPLLHPAGPLARRTRACSAGSRARCARRCQAVAPRGRPGWAAEIAARLPEPTDWPLEMLSRTRTHHLALTTRLRITAAAAQACPTHQPAVLCPRGGHRATRVAMRKQPPASSACFTSRATPARRVEAAQHAAVLVPRDTPLAARAGWGAGHHARARWLARCGRARAARCLGQCAPGVWPRACTTG